MRHFITVVLPLDGKAVSGHCKTLRVTAESSLQAAEMAADSGDIGHRVLAVDLDEQYTYAYRVQAPGRQFDVVPT